MLKDNFEGVTKNWEVQKTHKPFYNGGKIEISQNETIMVSTYEENLHFIDWKTGQSISTTLLSNNDGDDDDDLKEENEGISCFCINPLLSIFLEEQQDITTNSTANNNNNEKNNRMNEQYQITIATRKGLIKLYTYHNQKCIRIIKAHHLPILCMSYDPSGTLVATGSTDKTIKLFDIFKGHCTHIFRDHTDSIQRLYFHPNLQQMQLFSTSDDYTIRCYDLRDSECIALYKEHLSLPTALDVSDNGYLLVSAGRDKVLNFYELRHNVHLKTVLVMDVLETVVFLSQEHSKNILSPPPNNNDDDDDDGVRKHKHKNGNKNKNIKKNKKNSITTSDTKTATTTTSNTTSHDDTNAHLTRYVVLSAGEQGFVYMHSLQIEGKDIKSFLCEPLCILPLHNSPAELTLTYDPTTVNLLKNGQLYSKFLSLYRKHQNQSFPIATSSSSSNSNSNTSSTSSKSLSELIKQKLNIDASVIIPHSASIASLQYLRASGQVVIVTNDHVIYSFDIIIKNYTESSLATTARVSLQERRQLVGFNDDILDMKFIPRLLTNEDLFQSFDNSSNNNHSNSSSSSTTSSSSSSSSSLDQEQQLQSQSQQQQYSTYALGVITNSSLVRLFNNDRFQCLSLVGGGHTDIVLAMDVSPDGQWIATSAKDNHIRLWNVNDRKCYGLCRGHTDAVGAVALSRNHSNYHHKLNFLISGGNDKILKKWDVPCQVLKELNTVMSSTSDTSSSSSSNGTNEREGQVTKEMVEMLSSLSSSSLVAVSTTTSTTTSPLINSANTSAILHQNPPHIIFNLNILASVKAHDKDITTTDIAPNDTLIATGSQDKTIKLWNSEKLQCLATLKGHKRSVWKVQFSPIDKVLVSSSGDRTLKLWSLNDYTCLRTFEGNTASVLSVQFINNGLQLLSTAADGLVRLWTIRSGECEIVLDQHQDKVWAVTTPNDQYYTNNYTNNSNTNTNTTNDNDTNTTTTTITTATNTQETPQQQQQQQQKLFFTGGSDSHLCVWRDITQQQESERLKKVEEELVLEQQLHNDIRLKRYGKALSKSLILGHSHRTLTILKAILEEEEEKEVETTGKQGGGRDSNNNSSSSSGSYNNILTIASGNSSNSSRLSALKEMNLETLLTSYNTHHHHNDPVTTTTTTTPPSSSSPSSSSSSYMNNSISIKNKLDIYTSTWDQSTIEQMIEYIRDWNTNAKHSHVCTMIINSLFQTHGYEKLMKFPTFIHSLSVIISYSERHYQRLNRLHESTYLTEYILSLMTSFPTQIMSMNNHHSSNNSSSSNNNSNARSMIDNHHDDDEEENINHNHNQQHKRKSTTTSSASGNNNNNNKKSKMMMMPNIFG